MPNRIKLIPYNICVRADFLRIDFLSLISFIFLLTGCNYSNNTWDILVGSGHSPEHVCLYCENLNVVISGDQILPIITSNVSVSPTEPHGNPMIDWLESHERFKELLPDDVLVLPAHNEPFYGVQARLQPF